MNEPREFSFSDESVACSYDDVLVPVLFEPWARRLVEEHGPWDGQRVLDLATGTGIVARVLADHVGPQGSVIGTDINASMLTLARRRCAGATATVEFKESPAHPLELPDASVDRVVCQQGFQFFPDKNAAAVEIHRVLTPGGRVVATTWCPVAECEYIGLLCEALVEIGEPEAADMMKVPFDFLSAAELEAPFWDAGFVDLKVERQQQDMVLGQGLKQAVDMAYATPIGPQLRALPEAQRQKFDETLTRLVSGLQRNGTPSGRMVTHLLTAGRSS